MTLRFRELEFSTLHAGLGVRLIDDHTGDQAFGTRRIFLDIDDNGAWRELTDEVIRRATTAGGVIWFPWLERYRDARGLPARKYRVRVQADFYTPDYRYDGDGIEALVYPYDDVNPPATAAAPIDIRLLPNANYPFGPGVPVMRGVVKDIFGDTVPNARVSWVDMRPAASQPVPPLVTDLVLSDDDGEFNLPMRRAPLNTSLDLFARRPPPPSPGKSRRKPVTLPADLSTFQIMTIL